jgi:2-hydroxycyclohexanecarboxyl-CoA dehydrogenase
MTTRTALVTGAAAGIGRACAMRLAREGKQVGVLDLNQAGAEKVAEEIRAAGGKAIGVGADVSNRASVTAAVEKVRKELGPITILVNNAGITGFVKFEEITDEQWDTMYAVNVRGVFIVTQVVLPDMKAAHWGRIINISSSSAYSGAGEMVHYSSSKGAVVSFTRSLAIALADYGVTVNNIPPGSVMQTLMSEANRERFPVDPEIMTKTLPARRLGVPEDIANACCWLASEDSSYVTAQTIHVNGGRVPS